MATRKAPLTVTHIAPQVKGLAPLDWLAEMGAIAKIPSVDLEIVAGPSCNRDAVAQAFEQPREVFMWSGHGAPGGLAVPDYSGGVDFIGPKTLAGLVKCAAPKLFVVAACNSMTRDEHMQSVMEAISKKGINVIGYHVKADDKAAVRFNIELIRMLARGADLGDAFDVALESIQTDYPETAAGVFLMPGLTNGLATIVQRLNEFECRLESLDSKWTVTLEDIQRNVAELRRNGTGKRQAAG